MEAVPPRARGRVGAALMVGAIALAVSACGTTTRSSEAAPPARPTAPPGSTETARRVSVRFSTLRLPAVHSSILPGYLLVADRNNNRVLLLSPSKRIVWQVDNLRQPDDAFFTPGFRSIITNEEFSDTLVEVALKSRRDVWTYGHVGVPGRSPGYLDAPDDAYRLQDGITTVADIKNCRIVQLRRNGSIARVLGGSCVHDPPRGFASPNGDTPLPDGGLLVTEIGGWIDRLSPSGALEWSVRSPVSYPSDAQLLPDGNILVCGFTTPGKVVEMTRTGRVVWSFGSSSGPNLLDRPSLAIRLPNGLIAVNDDWRHRVIIFNPRTMRIVWQYGHTGVASSAPGYLDKPDGMDLLPTPGRTAAVPRRPATQTVARVATAPLATVRRIGSLPRPVSRLSAVALPGGRVIALGGLVNGASTAAVLAGSPQRLEPIGTLPAPTHDAAAVAFHGAILLFGGGQSVSVADVTRIQPSNGSAKRLHSLDEPLSDLGAAVVDGRVYLVGGYTGSRFASAVLEVGRGNRTTTVARLPAGTRYAGVVAMDGRIYVAGGTTTAGASRAVYRVDVRAGSVRRIGTLPYATAHAPLVSAGGALWLVGGDGSNRVVRIDPRTGATRIAATLPNVLSNSAAVTLSDGRIAVIGGDSSTAILVITPRA